MFVPVGALVGTLIAGWMVDQFGRKFSFMMCSIAYTIGWLLIILTVLTEKTVFRVLIFTGRFIGGIGVGIATLCAPVSKCVCTAVVASKIIMYIILYGLHVWVSGSK